MAQVKEKAKKGDGSIYLILEGNIIDFQEAASKGIAVTPVIPKKVVIKKLDVARLHLNDTKFLYELNELSSLISGGAVPAKASKRRKFSDSKKSEIVEEWSKVEATGKKNKTFAREIGVGYQAFDIKFLVLMKGEEHSYGH